MHRLELGAECPEARLDRVHALLPVVALTHAEGVLDAVVVRLDVGDGERAAAVTRESAGGMPLRDVTLVRAKRDLRVDRRRAADTTTGEERDELAVRERREAEWPEEVVRGLRLPAAEVRRAQVRPAFEQEHVSTSLRELAGDDASSGAGSDDDDVI